MLKEAVQKPRKSGLPDPESTKKFTDTYLCIDIHVHTCVHIYIDTCIYIYVNTHTHTHVVELVILKSYDVQVCV
jgi:hypothetical protein